MKIDDVCRIFKEREADFMCPVCGASFHVSEQKNFVCTNNHCFDIAAKGYVNFIPNKKQISEHYSKERFESRASVFESGVYDQVWREIHEIILSKFGQEPNINLLDVGCGEGYYAAKLSEMPGINVFAIDIIKDAILVSCKKKAPVKWMVADLANLPLRTGSIDVLLNILTSANYEEFKRVLSKNGIIIKVVPGNDYLKEIRELVKPQLRNPEYSNDSVVEYFEKHVEMIEKRTLNNKFPVDACVLEHFMQMTPMAFGINTGNLDFNKVSEITINLDILVGVVTQ